MTNRKRFNIDVSEDEDGRVEISTTTNQDISCKADYELIVGKLEEVFAAMKQSVTG
tara:strand:- start:2002 stop:2169 length:168 start_codon:yes stop_codon:yes gene_type:complete